RLLGHQPPPRSDSATREFSLANLASDTVSISYQRSSGCTALFSATPRTSFLYCAVTLPLPSRLATYRSGSRLISIATTEAPLRTTLARVPSADDMRVARRLKKASRSAKSSARPCAICRWSMAVCTCAPQYSQAVTRASADDSFIGAPQLLQRAGS